MDLLVIALHVRQGLHQKVSLKRGRKLRKVGHGAGLRRAGQTGSAQVAVRGGSIAALLADRQRL
jgi:hypothetical protein